MTVSQSSQEIRHQFVAKVRPGRCDRGRGDALLTEPVRRKVYGVLFCQIVGTTVIGALMSTETASSWVQANPGCVAHAWIERARRLTLCPRQDDDDPHDRSHRGNARRLLEAPLAPCVPSLARLTPQRALSSLTPISSRPALNIILLGLFTVLEAITVGSIVGFYNTTVVLQALIITIFVFAGLTLFTFQVRRSLVAHRA